MSSGFSWLYFVFHDAPNFSMGQTSGLQAGQFSTQTLEFVEESLLVYHMV